MIDHYSDTPPFEVGARVFCINDGQVILPSGKTSIAATIRCDEVYEIEQLERARPPENGWHLHLVGVSTVRPYSIRFGLSPIQTELDEILTLQDRFLEITQSKSGT